MNREISHIYCAIESAWGLCPLEWSALNLALYGDLQDSFDGDHHPSSAEGEAAYRRLQGLRVSYSNRIEAGHRLDFVHFLLATESFYLPKIIETESIFVDGEPEAFIGSAVELLHEMRRIIAISAARAPIAPAIASAAVAVEQAAALRDVCEAALLLDRAVNLRFVADHRPNGGPVREYTAWVEGFNTIEIAELDPFGQHLTVALASGYVYRLPLEFICAVEGIGRPSAMRVVTPLLRRAMLRIEFVAGAVLEWSCEQLLEMCEPGYITHGGRSDPRREIAQRWAREHGNIRLIPSL